MNKIFKVVWSKTKECYVVVSEVAKNNGGKKKVLASVLAGLAMVGAGAIGTPVQAGYSDSGSSINIWPNAKTGNYVGSNAVVVGFENKTDADIPGTDQLGRVIYGTGNIGAGNSALAVGNNNEARGTAVVAIGHGANAKAKQSVALGNVARAEKDGTVAIGTYVNAETTNVGTATVPKYNTKETGAYSTAVGAFSWTKGDYSAAYGYQAEATGTNAVAIGRVSKATGTSATAVGVNNKAQAQDSSAVGSSNTIDDIATQSSAFGRENTVNRDGSIAAGYKNTAVGQRNVAIGNQNTTAGEETIGIGTKVIAGTGKTIAIGGVYNPGGGVEKQTIARGNDTINAATGQVNNIFALAIGNGAQADGKAKSASGMIAIGQDVTADNNNTVAIGVQTKATGNNALAVGSTAQAIGTSSAAFGTQAVANGTGATAFGPGSSAGTGAVTADGSVAVGRKATVTAAGGVGIGWTASASEKNATAIGFSATASGVQSVAIGGGDEYDYPGTERGKHFTTASGKSSVAVGSYAKATEENAMAFGTDANANIAGGVALGSESKTTTAAGVQGYNPASDRTNKYSTQGGAVGTSTLAAVSIGDGSAKTRQLTGLAAGTADTDAVNVAQLKNVNLKYAGDTGNSDVLLKDGTLKVKGDNNFISTSADGTGITVTAKIGNPITANAAGKAEAPATNGLATTTNVADAINASGWNVVSSNNGGSVTGTQATKLVNPGSKVTLSAGKNIVLDQNDKQFTYSLNKDVDLTKDGSLTIGDTKINNAGMTITGGPSITKTGIDAGSKKITNVTAGTADTDAVNVKQLKDTEKHIKPDTYAVANDGSVTLKYVDGNGAEQTETAKITGIAKKSKVINGQNTTVEEGTDTTDNSVTYKVNVKGDLADISSITNGTGSGKISFEGDQVVKVGGDHPISFDGKGGYVTGLQNKDWDITNPTVVSGRAATEDQLKKVSDGFNNTVKLTGNSGATGTQKLNQNGGLSFGVVGADNGKYITTTASGSNVVADLSTDAKNKLNSKVVVTGSGAATVAAPTVTTNPDGSTVTTYTVHVDPATATAASTESVVKKAVTGDTNIADVSVADGKATGDVGAKYEVSVSRNAVKDAAREAVTVNNGGTTTGGTYTADTNNPISVTAKPDNTNHNTTYEVTFDGNKAAKQIPLTYKATNGTITSADQTVKLDKGLNFTGGDYTTASVGADGKVTFDVNLGTAPTVTDGKPGVPGQAGAAGKDGIATVKTVVDTINNSGWKANAKANGGKLDGTATATVVKPGNTVNYAAGKNLIVNQELETDASNALTGNQTYTYSLNKDIDLTNAGSLTVGDTTVNNGGITIKAPTPAAGTTATTDVKLTNTGLNNGGNTITNVAEGQNNTDAVNVKQLKANRTEVKAGDNVVVTSAVDATDNHTVYTVNAVTPAVYTTPDGTKLTKDKDGKFHKEGETAEYTGDIITSFENPKAATGQTTKDGGMIVNNIGSAIKNQNPTMPAGQTATYLDKLKAAADAGSNVKNAAVNVSDLHNTAEALKSNELHIRPTVTNRTGETVNQNAGGTAESYKYDSTTKSVTLKYNDGTGAGVTGTEAKIDLSDLANQITSGYTFKTNATENGGKVVNDAATPAAETAVANGGVVNYAAGKNLTVKQDIEKDGTGAATGKQTYTYALADEIGIGEKGQPGVAGKDGVDGKIGVNGKDGSSVVINGKDGSIGMTGPKGQDGKDGINGRDGANISMTSAKGEQVLVNRDPAHNADNDKAERIVYVPKDASGNPIQDNGKNIVREVATMDDGLKFGGDMGTVNSVKLNKQVDVKGGITDTNKLATGNNIGVTSGIDPTTNNATLNVQLAKDLTGLNSVELGGNTIKTDGDHITITSPDTTPGATPGATTTTKVANLSDELHITPGTYEVGAVDKDANAKNDEVTLTYTDGNGAEKANTFAKIKGVAKSDLSNINTAGKKVITGLGSVVKAGDNVTVKTDTDATTGQKTYTVNAVTPAVYTKADGTKVVKRPDGTFTTNVDGAPGNDVPASDVIVSFQDAAGNRTGGNSIVNNVGSAIDKPGTATGNTFLTKLDNAATDTPFAAVNVRDLKTTADALKANELHIAPTSGGTDTDKGGVVKTAGSTDMVYKYDAASKTVTLTYNDGNGKAVTGPKAVLDFTDLNIPAGGNNYGFKANATANGGKVANDTTTPAAATAVENGGTVNFAAGKNLTVKQDIDATNKTQTYTFSLDKDLTNLDKIVVNGKDGIDGKDGVSITGPKGESAPGAKDGQDGKVGIAGKDGKDAVSISGKDGVGHIGLTGPQGPAGTPGAPGTPGANIDISTDHGTQTLVKPEAHNDNKSERIVYVPKDANGNPLKDTDGNDIKREVATMDDGLRFTGNNTSKENKQPMNSLVKVQGEGVTENAAGKLEANGQEFKSAAGNIAVVAEKGDTLTVKMNKDLNLTKDGSVTMGDTVVNNDGITIKAPTTPGTTTTDVKLTNQGLDNGGNTITNVKAGENDTDAVNVKQLKDKVTTVTSSDSSIKVVDKNVAGQPGYDANKGHQYDITINNQGVVNNAQTPVVYTTEDGTKVYKQPDGTFTTNINGTGTVVPANQVIASMNSAGNSSTDPTKLQNVGSSIADKTGTTFLDKINTAAADPNAKYGAVNVTDLKSTSDALIDKGLVFDANNKDPKTNKLGSKVTIAGTGALANGENFADKYNTDNIRTNITQDPTTGNTTVEIGLNKNLKGLESVSVPGKDGVDGQDGVSITGKDGANGVDGKVSIGKDGKDAVSISGKDGIGHIGLTGAAGKDGTNTKADITVKEGQPGLNGTDGITRIVYKDKDGNDHEVATHDDGVKYAGDDAQGTDKTKVISKKLNQTIDIVGGADKTKLTDNNIGVNNDGGKLKVQLANELAGINTISNGGSSITFNSNPGGATNTPAVQISGGDLNMDGNKITNLKKGTAASDAATVGQLTKVKSSNNSVGITESTDANGAKVYDLSVTGVPGADPRVDKLGEEIGRVGAQGAALAALKPIQYDPLEPTQIMAGYGNYRGNSAVALGVAHYKNESTLIHGGVSWAGGSSHMMANAGVTWKVGNRDSEAAVADRYRKGPISSTYAMQQEMAAMKAQNAGLKGEVSDLKAENEQMKAQIAAMMAKLGL